MLFALPLLIGRGSLAVSVVLLTFSGLKTVLQGRIDFRLDFFCDVTSEFDVCHK